MSDDLYTARWVDGVIEVVLPLPDRVLGHHGGGWTKTGVSRKTGKKYFISGYRLAFGKHRDEATTVLKNLVGWYFPNWPAAVMHVDWRFAGSQPDSDGAWTRLSAYRDAAQHAHVVLDDKQVRMGTLTFTRVRRTEQRVVLRFERGADEVAA